MALIVSPGDAAVADFVVVEARQIMETGAIAGGVSVCDPIMSPGEFDMIVDPQPGDKPKMPALVDALALAILRRISAAPDAEDWHEIGVGGNPAFGPDWVTSAPGTLTTAAFYRDSFGRVWLKGHAKAATSWLNSTIFTLPSGYRPHVRNEFPIVQDDHVGRVSIEPNGNVVLRELFARTGSADVSQYGKPIASYVCLDGISFRLPTENEMANSGGGGGG